MYERLEQIIVSVMPLNAFVELASLLGIIGLVYWIDQLFGDIENDL